MTFLFLRDSTPKPQSPGASPSSGGNGRSKSPFSAKSPSSQMQIQNRAPQQGFAAQRQWTDASMQGLYRSSCVESRRVFICRVLTRPLLLYVKTDSLEFQNRCQVCL